MRVLWFTGVQLPAVTGDRLSRAGWQEGLRSALQRHQPEVDLCIASFGSDAYPPFRKGNATYYNIYREPPPATRLDKVFANWRIQLYAPAELDRCREIVHEVSPDVIFIFGTENPFGLLLPEWSVPGIISIQAVLNGLIKHIFDGLSPRERVQIFFSKETLLGGGVYHKYRRLRKSRQMEKTIYQSCNYFEGRTAWDRSWLEHFHPGAEYFHIDRVIGEAYYQEEWVNPAGDIPRMYTTSSNAPFKGGISLARAFIELHKRGHNQLKLDMAGVHPQSAVGKAIHRLVENHGLASKLTLLGRLKPSDILAKMCQANMFVLPSHMDNSPNSLAEAMLIGMPCIASSAGGIPSMISNGNTGLLYPHQDGGKLVKQIETFLENPDYAQQLGRQARREAISRHDPQRIAARTVKMYQHVVAQGEAAKS